ncbi:hypothetical protein EV368DRAFT_80350 [Lentinula lateritia]|nr:hypothetical protein EV368DRAFT_80350 [Lentinula lateritia]
MDLESNNNKNDEQGIHSNKLVHYHSLDFTADETLYDQVEGMIAENAKILDPLSAFMQYYMDVFTASPIPTPSNVSLQRVSALSEYGGLWMVNESREVVRIGLVVQMSQFRDDSKYGQYMDMNAYNSQITIDSFRRACARLFFHEVYTPAECTAEVAEIYNAHKTRFNVVLNLLQHCTTQYIDQASATDDKLYPDQKINVITFVHLHNMGYYGLQGRTMNIFRNTPSRRSNQHSSMSTIRGNLPDPRKLRASEKEKNLNALKTSASIDAVDIWHRQLGHWPDSEGYIHDLAEKHDLSNVKFHIPSIYDAQGSLVHPMDYENVLVPGCLVMVEFEFHLWDITKSTDGKAINRPSRIFSNMINHLHVLSDDVDDLGLLLHTEALNRTNKIKQDMEHKRQAEEAREIAKREEVMRIQQTMTRAKALSDMKKKRLEELRGQSSLDSMNQGEFSKKRKASVGSSIVGGAHKRVSGDKVTADIEDGEIDEQM